MLHMVRARWLWDERETTRTPAVSREAEDSRVGACEIDSAALHLCEWGPDRGEVVDGVGEELVVLS